MPRSLLAEGNPLAQVENQMKILRPSGKFKPFDARLFEATSDSLHAKSIDVLQINVGRMCNQTCKHCHVDAGPDRKEIMTQETMQDCLKALRQSEIPVVDLTGGAPEMNPHFEWLVESIRELGRHVMDRCNLTILTVPKYAHLANFLATHEVEVVASLPYYSASNTDRQRGEGVFDRSIRALRMLNELGYGQPNSGLKLNLVYNPNGAFLPPDQSEAESQFRSQLRERWGVEFTSLFTVTNQPINRFLEYLINSGNYERYMEKLVNAFNPASLDGVMCRYTLSVGWDGVLYDCDFNQMLDMGLEPAQPRNIADFDLKSLSERRICTGLHCYACTAGQGSSCTGATA